MQDLKELERMLKAGTITQTEFDSIKSRMPVEAVHELSAGDKLWLKGLKLALLCALIWFGFNTLAWIGKQPQSGSSSTETREEPSNLPWVKPKAEVSFWEGKRCIKCPLGVFRNGFCDMCHIATPDKAQESREELEQTIKSDPSLNSEFRCPYCSGGGCGQCDYKGILMPK